MNTSAPSSGIRTVTREELLELLERGDDRFRLVMALNEWAFRAKHIPGSEQFNTAQGLFSSLSPEDDIVVYCTSDDMPASPSTTLLLITAIQMSVDTPAG